MNDFRYSKDEKGQHALETALYRLGRLQKASDDDRAVITSATARLGKNAVHDLLLRICAMPVWYPGDIVTCEHGVASGVVRETDCEGGFWHQIMPASDGGTMEEIFTPAYTVIVEIDGDRAFCHRESLTVAK